MNENRLNDIARIQTGLATGLWQLRQLWRVLALSLLISAGMQVLSGGAWPDIIANALIWSVLGVLMVLWRGYYLLFLPVFVLGLETYAALDRVGLWWEPINSFRLKVFSGVVLGFVIAFAFGLLSRAVNLRVRGKGAAVIHRSCVKNAPQDIDLKDYIFNQLRPSPDISDWTYNVIKREFSSDDPFAYTDTMETKGPGGPTAKLHWRYKITGPRALFLEGVHEGGSVDGIGITVAFEVQDHPDGARLWTEITMTRPNYTNAMMIQFGNSGRQGPERIASHFEGRHDRSLLGVISRDYRRARKRMALKAARRSGKVSP